MTVTVARSTGFCSGVQRAIRDAERALAERGRIYCLGEIIHNPRVVEELKQRGLVVVDDIESVPDGSAFIVRSHGLPAHLLDRARAKGLAVYDFTCPKVKKIHRLVEELSREGYFILVAGNPRHPEVKAIHSLAENRSAVVQTPEEVNGLAGSRPASLEKVALVVQTTFDPLAFLDIVKETVSLSKTTLVSNTLCEETLKRQREAIELAGRADFIVVVGGKNSSNTRTLFEMVRARVPALHIEESGELDPARFRGFARIGIISGASTPEEEVTEVRSLIEGWSNLDRSDPA
jgi:(E)-4-hydroxy-3-methyl-but-2-enyl pyrophosphate reductase